METCLDGLTKAAKAQRQSFRLLLDYIVSPYSEEWNLVDDLIAKGEITPKYIMYLFRSGELIVRGKQQT